MNPKIVQAILLGAERRPLSAADFPESVGRTFCNVTAPAPEVLMLHGIAMLSTRESASSWPRLAVTPVPPFSSNDNPAPAVYSDLLNRIFKRPDLFAPLAAMLFEKMQQQGFHLAPEWLTAVLNAGVSRKFKPYRPLIKSVAGKRGEWLAQFHASWSYILRENEQSEQSENTPLHLARKRPQNTAIKPIPSDIQKEKEALQVLSNKEVEQYFLTQRPSGNPFFITDALVRPGTRWSAAFSRYLLEAMNSEDFIHHHADAPLRIAMQFHESAIPVLQDWLSLPPRHWSDQQLHKKVLSPLLDFLMLRRDVEKG